MHCWELNIPYIYNILIYMTGVQYAYYLLLHVITFITYFKPQRPPFPAHEDFGATLDAEQDDSPRLTIRGELLWFQPQNHINHQAKQKRMSRDESRMRWNEMNIQKSRILVLPQWVQNLFESKVPTGVEQHGSVPKVAHCQWHPQTGWSSFSPADLHRSKLHHENGDQQKEEQEPPEQRDGTRIGMTQNWGTHGRTN